MMNVLGMVIPWWGRWLVLAAMVVSAGITGYVKGSASVQREWELSDAKLAAASSKVQIEALAKARSVEKENADLNVRLEAQHAQYQKDISQQLADNRRLASELGGLRDPGAGRDTGAMSGSSGTAAGYPSGTAQGRLSGSASGFLLEFAAQCDETAQYAKTCHDWAVGLK